jgi:peptide/nickel transport system permease protein
MGAQPPTAELGLMITDGQQFFLTGQWWVAAFPGLVLLIAVTLTTVVADRAREILDPRGEYIVAD